MKKKIKPIKYDNATGWDKEEFDSFVRKNTPNRCKCSSQGVYWSMQNKRFECNICGEHCES